MEPVDGARVFSNRYELTHLIARGGMAQVYRARDRLLDRPVALKVLFPELSVDRTFVERFRREAQAAANLSHPNIVPVFDWGEDNHTYFIVMEFVDGQPLSAVLRSGGPLPPRRVADIGANVASALAYAHRHGVVHRDVKPGNVLITAEGQVKVTDFGIARAVNTEESLTQTGAVMGTATYFSPEQAEGAGVDARSDIYSLGVVLFEMTTGRPPFLGDSPVAVASKHVRDQPPLPRDLDPSVPPALEAVIMTAMAKSPANRYPTADDLKTDLLRFMDGIPVAAVDPGTTMVNQQVGTTATVPATTATATATRTLPVEPMPVVDPEDEARRRQTRRLLLALVALLIVLGVVAYFLYRAITTAGSFPLPNVVGEPATLAKTQLQAKGLVVSSQTVRDPHAAGIVVSTNPGPSAQVKKGDSVDLTVSGGPNQGFAKVPNLIGKSTSDAVTLLNSLGLGNRIVTTASQAAPQTVIASSPPPGNRIPKGQTVTLTVSTGPNSVQVPNLLGVPSAQAGATITNAQLKLGQVNSACSDQVQGGQVAAQNPAAGVQASPGTAVDITVSNGPCPTTTTTTVPPSTTTTTTVPSTTTVPPSTTTTTVPATTTTTH